MKKDKTKGYLKTLFHLIQKSEEHQVKMDSLYPENKKKEEDYDEDDCCPHCGEHL